MPHPRADKSAIKKPHNRLGRPSLVFCPFRNLSENPNLAYLADGLSEDVENGLSTNSALTVFAFCGDSSSASKPLTAARARTEFGAQFLFEGSVRVADQHLRITALLIECSTGRRVWAERLDRAMDDIFEVQEEIVSAVVHALGAADGVMERSDSQECIDRPPGAGAAYDYYLRGRYYFCRHGEAEFAKAEDCYLKAIDLDAAFAPAYSALAWLYFVEFKLFKKTDFAEVRSKAVELAFRALQLDGREFRAHWALGGLYLHDGRHTQSIAAFDTAILINSNNANLLAFSAEALVYAGKLDEAVERCERALRINLDCPDWYHWIKAFALFHQGKYSDALAALNRMRSSGYAGRLKAAIYAYLGNQEKAESEAIEYMNLVPGFSIRKWAKSEHYADPKELKRYIEGLRRAGLPN